MESGKNKKMIELLDLEHSWPDNFLFKFIYLADPITESKLKGLFSNKPEISIKSSKKKNYNSMTVIHVASSSTEVMEIYANAAKIDGVISL